MCFQHCWWAETVCGGLGTVPGTVRLFFMYCLLRVNKAELGRQWAISASGKCPIYGEECSTLETGQSLLRETLELIQLIQVFDDWMEGSGLGLGRWNLKDLCIMKIYV